MLCGSKQAPLFLPYPRGIAVRLQSFALQSFILLMSRRSCLPRVQVLGLLRWMAMVQPSGGQSPRLLARRFLNSLQLHTQLYSHCLYKISYHRQKTHVDYVDVILFQCVW